MGNSAKPNSINWTDKQSKQKTSRAAEEQHKEHSVCEKKRAIKRRREREREGTNTMRSSRTPTELMILVIISFQFYMQKL